MGNIEPDDELVKKIGKLTPIYIISLFGAVENAITAFTEPIFGSITVLILIIISFPITFYVEKQIMGVYRKGQRYLTMVHGALWLLAVNIETFIIPPNWLNLIRIFLTIEVFIVGLIFPGDYTRNLNKIVKLRKFFLNIFVFETDQLDNLSYNTEIKDKTVMVIHENDGSVRLAIDYKENRGAQKVYLVTTKPSIQVTNSILRNAYASSDINVINTSCELKNITSKKIDETVGSTTRKITVIDKAILWNTQLNVEIQIPVNTIIIPPLPVN